MADITFADISEFQESLDADAYIAGGHEVIICRVHNGYRPDHKMPERAVYVRSKPFAAVGFYQYLAASRDAATQAQEFCSTVGRLKANEFPILDLEEGAGDQTPRAHAWFALVDRWAGFEATLYSGASFLRSALGGVASWGARPLWIASYPASFQPVPAAEPHGADLWQYSDRESFPGLAGRVDGSIFHGTAQQLLAVTTGGRTVPAVTAGEVVAVSRPDGGQAVVTERAGEVFYAVQDATGGRWSAWTSLGRPGA
jgi:GH25 family lysozyme M1 (1,4-beta-N-acetylmuramidase)